MASVAMIGSGSIGAYVAAHLAASGHDVVACVRRPFDQYVVESPISAVTCDARCATAPEELAAPSDWVLVDAKAHQTESIGAWLAAASGPSSTAVALENGVEAVERLSRHVGSATVLPAVVLCDAELIAPGRVQHTARSRLIVPAGQAGDAFRDLMANTPIRVDPVANYMTKAWLNLSANVLCNGITALTGRPIGGVGEPSMMPVAVALVAETWATANAAGASLDVSDPERFVAAIAAENPLGRTFMRMDAEAGRNTEHDAIYGAVVRAADRHGVPVPTIRALLGLLDDFVPRS